MNPCYATLLACVRPSAQSTCVGNSLHPLGKGVAWLFLLLLCPVWAMAQSPYITVWKTDNPGISNDDQITIPATGDFNYTWMEVADSTNTGSGSGSGATTITFPNAGTYQLQMTPSGNDPFNRIEFGLSTDSRKLMEIKQWGDVIWTSFENAYAYTPNLTISAIDIPNLGTVTDMSFAFYHSQQIDTIPNMNDWNVSNVTNMRAMFGGALSFNQPIGNWDVSNVTNMNSMFSEAQYFNQSLNNWNVSNVTDMSGMFSGLYYDWEGGQYLHSDFNQPLDNWDVAQVIDMSSMFHYAIHFNQPMDNWNVGNVMDMSGMFWNATGFNQSLNNWDVSHVSTMYRMFENATTFNQPLNNWNVGMVTDMSFMFFIAYQFNQPLNDWNVSNVTNMQDMFVDCHNFDQSLNNWDVSHVTDMSGMFDGCGSFNQPLNNWNVSNVTDMYTMFEGAISFDQPLNDWDVGNVQILRGMFLYANNFNQTLGQWNLNNINDANAIFYGSGIDCMNYSLTLHGWANNPNTAYGANMTYSESDSLEYSPNVVNDRAYLVNTLGWDINGDVLGTCNLNVGIAETDAAPFSVYPNPAQDHLTVNSTGTGTYNLYDQLGRIVLSGALTGTSTQVDVSALPAGVYQLEVKTRNARRAAKVVVSPH